MERYEKEWMEKAYKNMLESKTPISAKTRRKYTKAGYDVSTLPIEKQKKHHYPSEIAENPDKFDENEAQLELERMKEAIE